MPAKLFHQTDSSADATLLDFLTGPTPPTKSNFARRDAALDPLLLAAATASGPHVTRNHYHHDFFPALTLPPTHQTTEQNHLAYVSRQAPRRQRLQNISNDEHKENDSPRDSLKPIDARKHRQSLSNPAGVKTYVSTLSTTDAVTFPKPQREPLEVNCMARTRIPTPHGPVFLHLYHNNLDGKEHLAIVVDPAQLFPTSSPIQAPPIRSRSLDAVWHEDETEMDRIIRGAYIGRLSPNSARAAPPPSNLPTFDDLMPPPLIRIHSECFTGETVGSMRCDCGEQLDEAIRRIFQPIRIGDTSVPGRGAVIYMRQEGRGIGLLSKIHAYNLQDMGHDTVTANLALGYQADERGYEIAAAILSDLGLGANGNNEGVRVLTNNPDKVDALRREGVPVIEHVPMMPRSWQQRQQVQNGETQVEKVMGATMVGGNAVHGEDLDKYLKTKIVKMGHMLPLWLDKV